jgi:hypothetical protein
MDNVYKTLEAAELAADLEFSKAVPVGEFWVIKPIILNADQVAVLIGKCKKSVYNMVHTGRLPMMIDPTGPDNRWLLKDIMPYANKT